MRTRLGALIAVALVSHLLLDSWNSYGVHPFWPFDSRWIYGDAIYIAEPWLWLLLGSAAALNTENRRGRVTLAAMLAVLVAVATSFRIVTVGVTAALAAGAITWSVLAWRWRPRTRSGIALALGGLFVVTMFALRVRVHARALASLDVASRDEIVDLVLSPQPGNPLCWNVLSVAKLEKRAEYATVRASATPFGLSGCGPGRTQGVVWDAPVAHSLPQLRELYARNCWVRGWLQFDRVPEVARGSIGDLRYGASDANFTSMKLRSGEAAARCPPHLTSWGVPRADLLGPPTD